MLVVVLIQAAHFKKFEAERLALGEHSVQRGLVGQHAGQNRVAAPGPDLQPGERGTDRLAQPSADADLVPARLRTVMPAGHEPPADAAAGRAAASARAMTSLMMPSLPCRILTAAWTWAG